MFAKKQTYKISLKLQYKFTRTTFLVLKKYENLYFTCDFL